MNAEISRYKDIDLITKKTAPTNYMPDAIIARAASLPFQYGGFVYEVNNNATNLSV